MKMLNKNKKAQEEMVGFAIILVIVAVIILIVLGFMANNPSESKELESYEVDSFLDSVLGYTTDCKNTYGIPMDIKNLIQFCKENKECSNNLNSCNVLETTLEDIMKTSWKTGKNRPIKGYTLNITAGQESIYSKTNGNITYNSKTGFQDVSSAQIKLNIYY